MSFWIVYRFWNIDTLTHKYKNGIISKKNTLTNIFLFLFYLYLNPLWIRGWRYASLAVRPGDKWKTFVSYHSTQWLLSIYTCKIEWVDLLRESYYMLCRTQLSETYIIFHWILLNVFVYRNIPYLKLSVDKCYVNLSLWFYVLHFITDDYHLPVWPNLTKVYSRIIKYQDSKTQKWQKL